VRATVDGIATSKSFCVDEKEGCPCQADEVACTVKGVRQCRPASFGCPVECDPSKELMCSMFNEEEQKKTAWCIPNTDKCPLDCGKYSRVCPSGVDGKPDMCIPHKMPCPLVCQSTEKKCRTFDATGDASAICVDAEKPCPVTCAPKGEHLCKSEGKEFCLPALVACPVTCKDGEIKCSFERTNSSMVSKDWCVDKEEGCPLVCEKDEHKCSGQDGEEDTCQLLTTACKVTCSKDEQICTMPGMDDTPRMYCFPSKETCPVVCPRGQRLCGDKCIRFDTPCTKSCGGDEKICPVITSEGAKDNVCIPESEKCPVVCGAKDHICENTNGDEKCVPLEEPCEVSCDTAQKKCEGKNSFTNATFNLCIPEKEPCPVQCKGLKDVFCPFKPSVDGAGETALEGEGTCTTNEDGCEVKCTEVENTCKQPFDGVRPATQYCVPGDEKCPKTCPPLHHACMLENGNEECKPVTETCKVICSETEQVCFFEENEAERSYCYPGRLTCPTQLKKGSGIGDDTINASTSRVPARFVALLLPFLAYFWLF